MAFDLKRFFGQKPVAAPRARPRLELTEWPAAVYAIGDVHGCLAQLRLLHTRILEDASTIPGEKLIVCLGDYVDRGVNSAGVLDYLTGPQPEGIKRICLAGNHEVMMLDHFANPRTADNWLSFGGAETLTSYGIDPARYIAASPKVRRSLLESHIPTQHIQFMESLPALLSLPGLVLVHAGIRPGVPLADQREDDLLWMRDAPEGDALPSDGPDVVHGHTPSPEPVQRGNSLCIDTGAFATGILTAVRLQPGQEPRFLNVSSADSQY